MNTKLIFRYISYLQYLLAIAAVYFTYKPIIFDFDFVLKDLNTALILLGLAISFSTLQDSAKTQNKFSRKI